MLDNAMLKGHHGKKVVTPLDEPRRPPRVRRAGSASGGPDQSLAPFAVRCATAIGVRMTWRHGQVGGFSARPQAFADQLQAEAAEAMREPRTRICHPAM